MSPSSSTYGFHHNHHHHIDDSSSSSIASFFDDSSPPPKPHSHCHSQSTSSSSSSSCHSQSSSLSSLSRQQLQLQLLQLRTPKLWRTRVVCFMAPLVMTIMMQLLYLRDAAPSSMAKVYHDVTMTTTTKATMRRTQEVAPDDWNGEYRISLDQPSILASTSTARNSGTSATTTQQSRPTPRATESLSKAAELVTNTITSATTSATPPPPPLTFPPPQYNFTVAQSAGACLLIKDDNHWLIEWLAFHYHVLPLRHLIVVIDPHSITSPKAILDRYRDLMDIQIWKERDFLPPIPAAMKQQYRNNTHLLEHRHRQGSFYEACLKNFQKQRVPWVQLTDTDEFTLLHYHAAEHQKTSTSSMQAYAIEQPGSVVRFLNAQQTSRKCLYMQRYLVGAAESNTTLVQRYVPHQQQPDDNYSIVTTPPPVINASHFLTQRFLMRSKTFTPYGKNMMHLTAATDKIMALRNPHRVSTHCPSRQGKNDESSFWVQVRHYIGTPDQFFFRSDPRTAASTLQPGKGNYPARDVQHYQHLHQQGSHTLDTHGQGWIQGFVEHVGWERAAYLLQGVGQVGVE